MTDTLASPHGRLLTTSDELHALLQRWQSATAIALDTEFLREKTYYPKLCLLQLCWQGEAVAIDVLAITDLQPLRDFLLDRSRIKILHSARQDLELLFHLWGAVPQPLFDSQIAADLVALGSQSGYARLVAAVFDHELPKDATRSNWCERPLSAKQLAYAYDDVIWLERLYHHLDAALTQHERQDWMAEEMAVLAEPELHHTDPQQMWQRIRGRENLTPRQLRLLQHLAAWRERFAMQRDLPRKWVLSDSALLALAALEPQSLDAIQTLEHAEAKQLQNHAQALIAMSAEVMALPAADWLVEVAPVRLTGAQKNAVNALDAKLQAYASEQKIDAAIIASRKQLAQIISTQSLAHVTGWRRALLEHCWQPQPSA